MIEDLKLKKFPVLDQGFVALVDVMGDDHAICDAARISYGTGTRSVSDDTTLIRYLMRCRHTSPFEQAELKFLVCCPMDVWRQWIRHRTASVNEYSTRYSEAIDASQETNPQSWRSQSVANKQGSGGPVSEWPEGYGPSDRGPEFIVKRTKPIGDGRKHFGQMMENSGEDESYTPGHYLSEMERDFHVKARSIYEERLKFGVAREQARKDLPLSTYTSAYWKIDLHNLFHFLGLRLDPHAQLEIRQYAQSIADIVKQIFPISWEAFEDYRLNAVTLTELDIRAIKFVMDGINNTLPVGLPPDMEAIFGHIANKREREECLEKLKRLGIL